MAERINKPFNTVNRRFNVGDPDVSPSDIQGDISFERWKELGYIGVSLAQAKPDKWSPKVVKKDLDAD